MLSNFLHFNNAIIAVQCPHNKQQSKLAHQRLLLFNYTCSYLCIVCNVYLIKVHFHLNCCPSKCKVVHATGVHQAVLSIMIITYHNNQETLLKLFHGVMLKFELITTNSYKL